MMHGPQLEAAKQADGSYDFRESFRFIQPLLEQVDLAIGNLELTLPGHPPYKGWPSFRSPDELAVALGEAGFDVLMTANNHSNDGRQAGVTHTIEVLEKNGIYHTGTFKDTSERVLTYPLLVYKKGFKIAFLNYTYGTDLKPNYPPTFVNKMDWPLIKKDIATTKSLRPDIIIAMMHWGGEYALLPRADEEELAIQMLEWGVDAVIGSHPHVVQPIEVLENGPYKKVIAYSLGNFISNQQQPNTNAGILVELALKKMPDGTATIEAVHYSTIYRYIHKKEEGGKSFFCLPISPFQDNTYLLPGFTFKERAKMIRADQKIRNHLNATSNCAEKRYRLKPNQGVKSLYH